MHIARKVKRELPRSLIGHTPEGDGLGGEARVLRARAGSERAERGVVQPARGHKVG